MTREEAKRRLLDIERCTPIHTREDARDFEALEMAIQALLQEPISLNDINNALEASFRNGVRSAKVEQEPCDDAISREDAIGCLTFNGHYDTLNEVYERLKKLPSVTKKSGMWNTFELFQGGIKETWYECPKCKWSNALLIPRNYCPNCGAKMESEDKK